ncbi:hypothetical protein E2C01_050887 [Portunus trituberculatus]|uniref:Uncharacterized protein n=1 Tax=Portunus trituberculatus TaxID=210409 RepID=A0A5B7G9H5_PORTR|nr:hypothetical protein [Portunus trituberculatus]
MMRTNDVCLVAGQVAVTHAAAIPDTTTLPPLSKAGNMHPYHNWGAGALIPRATRPFMGHGDARTVGGWILATRESPHPYPPSQCHGKNKDKQPVGKPCVGVGVEE